VSVIALGCEGFTGKTEAQVREDMDFAIGEGVNFIDMDTSNPDVRRNIGTALKGRRKAFVIGLREERCPFGVEIIEGMHKATDKFGY
jgi:aryl-alcohol dehydrogenase-like predicted oxidoreductase